MDTVTMESIPIVVGREDDGRWWADIESMPGVMAYGVTRHAAIAAVRSLALRVAADCIEMSECLNLGILPEAEIQKPAPSDAAGGKHQRDRDRENAGD